MNHLNALSHSTNSGQSLVELLLAIGIAAVFLPALITGLIASREGKVSQSERLRAVALLREAEEATRSVREASWTAFAINGTFYPAVSGSSWVLTPGTQTLDGFTRSVVVKDVYRDESGTIASSAGMLDPSTKQVAISVSWNALFPASVTSTSYLTRHNNAVYIQTTEEDFNAGTLGNIAVTNNEGGEITLGAGGRANWCTPDLSIAALDLPKQGVANALTAIEGKAFAGTGENASGISFANITIGNTIPPVASLNGTFDGYKTNDVFGEESFAYIATDTNAKEIVILTLGGSVSEVGYFDAPGPADANSIFVSGSTGYMTQGSVLRNFDLSSKTGSRPAIDSDGVALAGTGTAVVVVGSYAYVSISGSSTELQIVDISNPSNLTVVGQADVNGQGAKDVFVNTTGSRAYLVTGASESQMEFFIVDTSTKTGNLPTRGSYEANGMNPKALTVVPGNRAIIVGTGGEEYQVINISSEASPTRCGGLHVDSGVNGVSSVLEEDGDAFSYIITGDAGSEFKMIEGGPGGTVSPSGVFESSTFDAGSSTAFNRFDATANIPPLTNITYQVAIADAVAGSCIGVTFTYIGPDGSSESKFATGSALPYNDDGVDFENPGRCFRYKAYLTTEDTGFSPILYDFTVNYSP